MQQKPQGTGGTNSPQKSKKTARTFVNAVMKKVSNLRENIKFTRSSEKGKADQQKSSLESVLRERMQQWGVSHNLPEWAQAKMAQSVIKEEERRKRRAELQARKEQLLKQATIKHAIIIGTKAAEEAKRREEAKKMPEMRKGDLALPYQLKSLDLDSLVSSKSESSSSSGSISSTGSPGPATPTKEPVKQHDAKQADSDNPLAALIDKSVETKPEKVTSGPADNSIQAYIDHLNKNDLWEKESADNALYNWLISQTSPDDAKKKPEPKRSSKVKFDPMVIGKTFPGRAKMYDKDEPSRTFEGPIIG